MNDTKIRNNPHFDLGIQGRSQLFTKIIKNLRGEWDEKSGDRDQIEDQTGKGNEGKRTSVNILITES